MSFLARCGGALKSEENTANCLMNLTIRRLGMSEGLVTNEIKKKLSLASNRAYHEHTCAAAYYFRELNYFYIFDFVISKLFWFHRKSLLLHFI